MAEEISVRPVFYDDNLTIEEAGSHLKEVQKAFKYVQKKYLFNKPAELPKEDIKLLFDCQGVLTPLVFQCSVMKELMEAKYFEETVYRKSSLLLEEILLFLSKFSNTGVYTSSDIK